MKKEKTLKQLEIAHKMLVQDVSKLQAQVAEIVTVINRHHDRLDALESAPTNQAVMNTLILNDDWEGLKKLVEKRPELAKTPEFNKWFHKTPHAVVTRAWATEYVYADRHKPSMPNPEIPKVKKPIRALGDPLAHYTGITSLLNIPGEALIFVSKTHLNELALMIQDCHAFFHGQRSLDEFLMFQRKIYPRLKKLYYEIMPKYFNFERHNEGLEFPKEEKKQDPIISKEEALKAYYRIYNATKLKSVREAPMVQDAHQILLDFINQQESQKCDKDHLVACQALHCQGETE